LYNVPTRTACDLLPETVADLSKIENIVGIKEASLDPERLSQLKNQIHDESFILYSGDDLTACKFLNGGGHGIISVTANVVPEKISKICELALSGLAKEAQQVDSEITNLHDALFIETSPIPVKWVLNRLGRIPPGIRLPLTILDEEYVPKIELILNKLGLTN
jgi:4-hydroxy-tetrahydrodipicolinate synthase